MGYAHVARSVRLDSKGVLKYDDSSKDVLGEGREVAEVISVMHQLSTHTHTISVHLLRTVASLSNTWFCGQVYELAASCTAAAHGVNCSTALVTADILGQHAALACTWLVC